MKGRKQIGMAMERLRKLDSLESGKEWSTGVELKYAPVYSLVLPTYNPGKEIEHTLWRIKDFLTKTETRWEAIFVCDGCTDGTPERIQNNIGNFIGQIRVIQYSPNQGKGYAVKQGLLSSRGKYRIFTDCDLAYRLEDVLLMSEWLEEQVDSKRDENALAVVIASREHPQSEVTMPVHLMSYFFRRQFQSRIFGKLARWLLPIAQLDTQAGLKGLTASAVEKVLPILECHGFGFDCELLTACAYYQIPVLEMPVRVHYANATTTTSVQSIRKMLRELVQIRQRWQKQPQQLDRRERGNQAKAA